MAIAEELAKKQKAISVAEFFEKNRQILGFDSAPRSLITCVKEAVDNALDACEDASILPDIFVQIARVGDALLVTVEDNGPGIVREQIPRTFAKLLYGSRFHVLKQSRGQQGIGISAAVLYSQLTSGKPTKIISRIDVNDPAHYYELIINTKANEPEIIVEKTIDWNLPHGTRIEMEVEASYVRGRRQSVHEYMKSTAIVNPHARLTLIDPDGNRMVFDRVTDRMPPQPKEIKPHLAGMELGTLIKMLRYTDRQKAVSFLMNEFSRMGRKTAEDICKAAAIGLDDIPANLSHNQAKRLLGAFRKVKVQSPPTDCLSPIGEDQIYKGLKKEYDVDFISTTTRSAMVHSGNPFIVEAGIAFGGSLRKEDRIEILRFANKVPLLYQQGGCAITHAIGNVNWRNYELNQSGGNGIPVGPAVLFVHVASTKVPFTSESKDAIADIPEIMNEVKLAVQEVARDMKSYLSRKKLLEKRKDKEEIIKKILPQIVSKVSSILEKEEPDIRPVIAKIMGNVLIQREINQKDDGCFVYLKVSNFDEHARSFKLHDLSTYDVVKAPGAQIVRMGDSTNLVWKVSLGKGEQKTFYYAIDFMGMPEMQAPIVEGIDEEIITGAKVV